MSIARPNDRITNDILAFYLEKLGTFSVQEMADTLAEGGYSVTVKALRVRLRIIANKTDPTTGLPALSREQKCKHVFYTASGYQCHRIKQNADFLKKVNPVKDIKKPQQFWGNKLIGKPGTTIFIGEREL